MIIACKRCGANNRVPEARLSDSSHCGKCKTALTPPGEPLAIGSEADFDSLLRGAKVPVVIDFWAEWCGPCRAVAPELEKLAARERGKLIIGKLDTEAVPSVAARFGIRGIPTFVLFQDGSERRRASGAMPAAAIAAQLGL